MSTADSEKQVPKWAIFTPLLQFVSPGISQLLFTRRVLGLVGLVIPAALIFAITYSFITFLKNQEQIFNLLSDPNFLMYLEIFVAVSAAYLIALAVVLFIDLRPTLPASKKRIFLLVSSVIVAMLQTGISAGAISLIDGQRNLISSLFVVSSPAESHAKLQFSEGRVNILLLGGDAGDGRWGLRPDSISVASIDAVTGKTVLIGIPRNLQNFPFLEGSPMNTVFPGVYDCGDSCLINSLYTFAHGHEELFSDPSYAGKDIGVEATKSAVEAVTGLTIQYYVLVDMAGFSDIIDSIGGIDVCVPGDVVVEGDLQFAAGCQRMDGASALIFSRTRHDSSDYVRMQRQRLVQDALLAQADPVALLTNFNKIASAGSEYVKTDIPQKSLGKLLHLALEAKSQPTEKIELVPPTVDVVWPDVEAIKALVIAGTSQAAQSSG